MAVDDNACAIVTAIVAGILAGGVLIGYGVGWACASFYWRREAVKYGHANWFATASGRATWDWLSRGDGRGPQ